MTDDQYDPTPRLYFPPSAGMIAIRWGGIECTVEYTGDQDAWIRDTKAAGLPWPLPLSQQGQTDAID